MKLATVVALIVSLLTVSALADGGDTAKTAGDLVKKGQYGQAQLLYQRLIDAAGRDADRGPVLIARADAYFAAGEYGKAQAALAAARALPLGAELTKRADVLSDKIADKLSWQRFEASATMSLVHDTHVRHRVRVVSSANGTEIIEICDDEPSFDDFDDGPSVITSENCYYEEVTGDSKASTQNINIADWQFQTASKVEHQFPLDSRGSYWRTVAELTQSWQVIAADQDNRVIRARTGPSWFEPDWQARFDLNLGYLTGRQNHVTNLQYLAPMAAWEWRPMPNLRLNSNYQYESRRAFPSQQNGHANLVDTQLRWDMTPVDTVVGRTLLREQVAQFAYNSYRSEELRAGYRRGFKWWFGLGGGFAEAELRARFSQFYGAAPSDSGLTRRDVIPTGLLVLGQEFGKAWTVKISCSYNEVDSSVVRYNRDDFQYYLAVTRKF
ncbi:MAG TPA: hypothetical protein VG651_22705 [Stellaceae bacterium]|nr:hypothetical protein [Stellaceae bacterium]